MSMFKIASGKLMGKYCEASSCETCSRACSGIRLAEKSFGCSQTFPEKYAQLFNEYSHAMAKVATKQKKAEQVGTYDPEFHYYRVIAMHGDIPNDNGDLFRWGNQNDPNEPELLRYSSPINKFIYQTFIGRGNFKNHQNDDVSKAVGIILDVVPNYNGKFIEALLAVDGKKDPELVRSIDKGYISDVSMGSKVGHSLCSICNHKARIEAEYCSHIKFNKAQQIFHEGKMQLVYEDNRDCNFIELSWVTVGADKDAKKLEKIAQHYRENAIEAVAVLISLYGEEETKNILKQIT